MTVALAAFLRPFVFFVLFVLVIAPATWLLFKIIPPGRSKVFLFKDRTGEGATPRDKALMVAGVLLFYAVLFFGFWLFTT